MASAQDCHADSGEPASVSSSQSVEVKMEALWWYGICGGDGKSVESGSHVVDDQTAGNGIIETSDGENPQTDRDDHTLEPMHKIFLSHSGAQAGFAEQLCVELKRYDRHPFFDKDRNSLPIGEKFPKLIFKAIEQCQVGVAVLSEEYFTRTKWPMLEFAAMARRQGQGLQIMPVYFAISRAECRNPVTQKRWLKVWQGWEQTDRRIHLDEWKQALKLLGPTNGLIYTHGTSEVKFREEIVEAVCRRVPPATMMDDSHVRAKSRFCQVLHEKIAGTSVCESYAVRVLGLYGTGGIGKSTMIKVLCNEYYTKFQGRVCHLEFNKQATEHELLQEALKKLTDTRPELLEGLHIDMCRYRLKRNMYRRPVFLAIDNVVDTVKSIEQATMYLKAGYNQGSIVIVAARSLGQLTGLGISESECLEMPELEEDEARSLFLDQFQLIPENIDDEDEELLMRCVKRCRFRKGDSDDRQYVPLALEVLGKQLCYLLGFNPRQWAVELQHFDAFNPIRQKEHPIFSILRWSYDALQREDQLIFMDAALFFPRFSNDWSGLVPKWNILDWLSLVHGINVGAVKFLLKGLKRKSLLENLGDGFNKVGMHDLWHEFAMMETTRGKYEHWRWLYDIAGRPLKLQPGHLSACKNLHRIMCCGPSLFDNLSGNLRGDFIFHFGKVTVLHLDANQNVSTVDVTSLMHLRSLALNMTDNGQVDVPGLALLHNLGFLKILCKQISPASVEEIGRLTALQVLELKVAQCDKLPDLRNLKSLRVVSCNGFRGAETIPGLSSELMHLQYLVIRSATMHSVPGVDTITTLQELDISECCSLVELPNLENLTNLRKLSMTRCKSIKELPGFGSLVSLQEFLAYDCTQITELPDVGQLTHLHTLWCNSLKAVPGLGELSALRKLGVELQGVEDLCQLKNLHTLRIDGWSSSGILDTLAALHRLEIHRCMGVHTLTGVENLTMKSFYVDQCEFEDVSVLSNLTSLQELLLEECYRLERLPDLSKLTQLESITIDYCYWLESLVGIGPLPNLETLHCSASSVTELPDLSDFPRLRTLYLRKCRSLWRLFSTGPLSALIYFNVYKCWSLESLPDLRDSLQLQTLELRCSGVRLSSGDVKLLKASCRRIQINMDRRD